MIYNVLIVEDDPMVLFINQSYLEKVPNFKLVGSTDSTKGALDLLNREKIDLIFIDVHLIQGNGFDLVKTIRKHGLSTDIIMITAEKNSIFIEEMFRYGVIDYILKPFNFERFEQSLIAFETRKNILCSNKKLSQTDVDQLNNSNQNKEKNNQNLEKGLTPLTLKLVKEAIYQIDSPFTINDLNKKLNLSHVSIRKYVKYLEDSDFLITKLEYQSIGRPITLYYAKEKN